MLRIILFLSVGIALCIDGVAAQNAHLVGTVDQRLSEFRTVPAILEAAGCNPLWLSRALVDSGISLSSFDRPQDGMRVYLKDVNCSEAPPADVAERSKSIMARPAPKSKVVTLAPRPPVDYQALYNAKEKEFKELKLEKDKVDLAVKELKERLATSTATPPASSLTLTPPPESSQSNLNWWLGGGAILVAIVLLAFFAKKMFRKRPPPPSSTRMQSSVDPNLSSRQGS